MWELLPPVSQHTAGWQGGVCSPFGLSWVVYHSLLCPLGSGAAYRWGGVRGKHCLLTGSSEELPWADRCHRKAAGTWSLGSLGFPLPVGGSLGLSYVQTV